MYAWGDLQGYASAAEHTFNNAAYEEAGLNQISSDLTPQEDAAFIYYGGMARIPSAQQFSELLQYTEITRDGNVFSIRSTINGRVIHIYARGEIIGTDIYVPGTICLWTRNYISEEKANYFYVSLSLESSVRENVRARGLLILPVKSS